MNESIVTTSWDDGHPLDLKLAEMLRRYDVPATFYIPLANVERETMSPQQIREIAGQFEVGGHGCRHLDLTRLSTEGARREVVEGKRQLEDATGAGIAAFCYPRGGFNEEIIGLVGDAGFTGARTTRSMTRGFRDPFRMSTTVNALDWSLPSYVKHSLGAMDPGLSAFLLRSRCLLKGWHIIAIETLRFVAENGGIWHLWGHSWQVQENDDWHRLETVLRAIAEAPKDVKRMTNGQLMGMMQGRGCP